jgi:hypothetical protein
MSSSSTNKQPLLIDRPLFEVVGVGETAALSTPVNLRSLVPAGLRLFVDSGSDGCMIDSITAIAPETGITASRVIVVASKQSLAAALNASNAWPVASADFLSVTLGQRTNLSLLPLLAPVPNLASPAATVAAYPAELDKKNAGLILPGGWYLYAGVSVILQSSYGPSQAIVAAQGGYY